MARRRTKLPNLRLSLASTWWKNIGVWTCRLMRMICGRFWRAGIMEIYLRWNYSRRILVITCRETRMIGHGLCSLIIIGVFVRSPQLQIPIYYWIFHTWLIYVLKYTSIWFVQQLNCQKRTCRILKYTDRSVLLRQASHTCKWRHRVLTSCFFLVLVDI